MILNPQAEGDWVRIEICVIASKGKNGHVCESPPGEVKVACLVA